MGLLPITFKKNLQAKNSNRMPRKRTDLHRKRHKLRKRTTICGTWNVQGLSRKVNEVVSELKHLRVDVAVLTETKKKGRGSESWGDYDHFFSGVSKDQRAKRGVSILVHKRYRKLISNWEPINERLIKINLILNGYRVTVLGVYALNDDETVKEKDAFFEQLHQEIGKIGTSRELIILGDFNSRVGRKKGNHVVGEFGESTENDNGKRLISVCEQNQLKILNGFFQHRDIHKFTWTQNTKNLKSIIDYVITRQNSRLIYEDVRVNRGISCGSDHYFLKTRITASYDKKLRKSPSDSQNDTEYEVLSPIRYNLEGFDHESIKLLYKQRLDTKLNIEYFDTIEEEYNHLKSCLHSAASEALGTQNQQSKRRKPYWWDDEIEGEIEAKRREYQKYLSSGNANDRERYKIQQKKVRYMIAKKKNDKWENTCQRLNAYLGGKRSTESWRVLKKMRNDTTKEIISPITPNEWKQHFADMLNEDRQEFTTTGYADVNITTQGTPVTINTREVEDVCQQLKNGRSPGPGNIPAELIKYGSDKLYERLRNLFQRCINESAVPSEWNTSYITTIHKKGDKSRCDNYRGISVSNTLSRTYGRILKKRIEEEYSQMEAEEQAGFRAGRSTIDHLFTVTQFIEKKLSFNQEVHLLFVDLKKAYDSVPLAKLWEILQESNINVEVLKAVKSLYENYGAKVKLGNKLTSRFSVSKGLKQGCCLSPSLFKIYLERALKVWKSKCHNMGTPLDEETTLYTLSFADDQIVIAQDVDDLNYMTRKLVEEYAKWGLEVNIQKTQYLCIGGGRQSSDPDLTLSSSQSIKQCKAYKYLGLRISEDGVLDESIRERNTLGRRAISMLNGVLWDKNISKENKKRIYNTIVKSIVTYSSEVWPIKAKTEKMLMATEMDFWRRSAGRSRIERIRNERIREIMGVKSNIVNDIRTKQLIWFGHVQRMPDNRIPKKIFKWTPQGRRRRGRPRKSWREGVDKEMRDTDLGEELWRDRAEWRLEIGRRRRTF